MDFSGTFVVVSVVCRPGEQMCLLGRHAVDSRGAFLVSDCIYMRLWVLSNLVRVLWLVLLLLVRNTTRLAA
jgi:hypothetical protein